jgi:hypothetical protein
MRTGRPPTDPWERILKHVIKNETTGCWEWSGFRNACGYGLFWLNGRQRRVHKFTLERKLGRKFEPLEVTRHMCHNPCCCNPDHLEVGTANDNMQDKVRAGRQLKGEENGASKLTNEQVAEIRAFQGMHTCKELSEMYGVHSVHISRIHNNRTRYYD